MKPFSFLGAALTAALFTAIFAAPLGAQTYPSRPIHLIVPNTAGGATDVAARLTGPKMAEDLGQPVVIENRVAAGGVVATNQVAQAAPDGYTLIMVFDSFTSNPYLFHDVKYDAVRDFAPVSLVVRSPQVLVAHPELGARNLEQFVRLARAQGSALDFGTAGPGTSSRLGMELFKQTAGLEPTAVHYKGGGALMKDLLGGQVKVTLITLGVAYPNIKAGRLVPIAVTSGKRAPLLPDVPTISETYPGFETHSWLGLLAPAATPRPIVDRLHGAMVKVLAAPDIRQKFEGQGYEVVASTPEIFASWIQAESARWGRLIRERHITLE